MNIISITQKRINENSIGRFGLTKKAKYHIIIFLCLFFFEKKYTFQFLIKLVALMRKKLFFQDLGYGTQMLETLKVF